MQAIAFNDINDMLQSIYSLHTALLKSEKMGAVISILDLSCLACLAHLILKEIYPEELTVPPACRLDLYGEARAIREVCWQTGHP